MRRVLGLPLLIVWFSGVGLYAGATLAAEPKYESTSYEPMGPKVQKALGIPEGPSTWLGELREACKAVRDIRRLQANEKKQGVRREPQIKFDPAEIARLDRIVDQVLAQGRAQELIEAILASSSVPEFYPARTATITSEALGFQILSYLMTKHALEMRESDSAKAARWLRAVCFISACNELEPDGRALYRIKVSIAPLPDLANTLGISSRAAKQLVALADEASSSPGAFPDRDDPGNAALLEYGETFMHCINEGRMSDERFEVMLRRLEEIWIRLAARGTYCDRLKAAVAGWQLKNFADARKEYHRSNRVKALLVSLADTHVRNAHERRWLLEAANAPGPDPKMPAIGIISGPYSPYFRNRPPD